MHGFAMLRFGDVRAIERNGNGSCEMTSQLAACGGMGALKLAGVLPDVADPSTNAQNVINATLEWISTNSEALRLLLFGCLGCGLVHDRGFVCECCFGRWAEFFADDWLQCADEAFNLLLAKP
jgi:hypothetical protein